MSGFSGRAVRRARAWLVKHDAVRGGVRVCGWEQRTVASASMSQFAASRAALTVCSESMASSFGSSCWKPGNVSCSSREPPQNHCGHSAAAAATRARCCSSHASCCSSSAAGRSASACSSRSTSATCRPRGARAPQPLALRKKRSLLGCRVDVRTPCAHARHRRRCTSALFCCTSSSNLGVVVGV